MSLSSGKPQRIPGLFGSDWMRPGRFKTEFASRLLSGLFRWGFNHRPQRVAYFAGILPVGVIDAPELIPGPQSRGRAHGV
jgi:hypothetical protein